MNPKPDTRTRIIETAEQLLFKQGFSGTSLNEVMTAAKLSKGAFFHHFKGKEDLAHAVLKRWADNDDALMQSFADSAASLAEDPLQEATLYIKLFEQWLTDLETPLGGCLLASFTYESGRFDPSMCAYIKSRLSGWMAISHGIFDRLVRWADPKAAGLTPEHLVEMFAALIEGGVLLARAMDDRLYLVRQLQQFRTHLALLFSNQP